MEIVEKIMNILAQSKGTSWMLVLYNHNGAITSAELETTCSESGAGNTRVITICSVGKIEGILYVVPILLMPN